MQPNIKEFLAEAAKAEVSEIPAPEYRDWIPVSTDLLQKVVASAPKPLSKDTAFTAVLLDAREDRIATVAEYAMQWEWTQESVRAYLIEIGM